MSLAPAEIEVKAGRPVYQIGGVPHHVRRLHSTHRHNRVYQVHDLAADRTHVVVASRRYAACTCPDAGRENCPHVVALLAAGVLKGRPEPDLYQILSAAAPDREGGAR